MNSGIGYFVFGDYFTLAVYFNVIFIAENIAAVFGSPSGIYIFLLLLVAVLSE
jgi:hypothetical protein